MATNVFLYQKVVPQWYSNFNFHKEQGLSFRMPCQRAAYKSCCYYSRQSCQIADFRKYGFSAQNNNENVFFDPNLPCDCGLHFFIGPKLFFEKFIFCSKNAFFFMFSRLYKSVEKVFTELHFVKMNIAHVLIDKKFSRPPKIFS